MVTLWLDVVDRDGKAWVGNRWDKDATAEQMNAAVLAVEAWVRAVKAIRHMDKAD